MQRDSAQAPTPVKRNNRIKKGCMREIMDV